MRLFVALVIVVSVSSCRSDGGSADADGNRSACPDAVVDDCEVLRFAFRAELAPDRYLMDPPVKDLEDLNTRLIELETPVEAFSPVTLDLSGQDIVRSRREIGEHPALEVQLPWTDRVSAVAIGPLRSRVEEPRCVVLAIPGSGSNQALALASFEAENYQSGIEVVRDECDLYVYVKPNHGPRAIHDGEGRLSGSFVFNRLLERGGSFAAHYILEAATVARALEAEYETVVVAGLSQGGLAAFLVGWLVTPDAVVVASGYSVLIEQVQWGDANQIVIPGIYETIKPGALIDWVPRNPSRFLFTFGREETGLYGLDVADDSTCSLLSPLPNVECVIHDGGHEYPPDELRGWLGDAA